MKLPRIAVWGLHQQVTPLSPYKDRTLRSLWIFSYLNTRGLLTEQIDDTTDLDDFNVLYCDRELGASRLEAATSRGIVLMQSASNPVIHDLEREKIHYESRAVSIYESSLGNSSILTIKPHLATLFENRRSLPHLINAIHQACNNQLEIDESFGIMPYPSGALTSVIFLVHGEGGYDYSSRDSGSLANFDAKFTYAVSEDALSHYPELIKLYHRLGYEIGIHNHRDYGSTAETLLRNSFIQNVIIGNKPGGFVGEYLHYHDDLFSALQDFDIKWYVDDDIPYPLNIPGTDIIDITESLKPYDQWWVLRSKDRTTFNYEPLQSIWRTHLAQKMLRWEISVFHWHDITMTECQALFQNIIDDVNRAAQIWQCTAVEFVNFWRKRARVKLDIHSLTRHAIDFKVTNAFPGMTVFAKFGDQYKYYIFTKSGSYSGSSNLIEMDQPAAVTTDSLRIEFSDVLKNRTSIEFVVINETTSEFKDHPVRFQLPDRLVQLLKVSKHEWDAQIVQVGIKGLQFERLLELEGMNVSQLVNPISFEAPYIAPHSMSFYRILFKRHYTPIEKLPARVEIFLRNNTRLLFLVTFLVLAISIIANITAYRRIKTFKKN
ncbi:MAG: hypothetical protein GTO51_01970 [Candidatus Latescibacteria bacterium]|nr:hypothetical protein [Candidatus Latescibacterota bacterium]NIM22190.1 hypothetical protein [Candidatus Latescibacterota bacterium]NIM64740.1 hypothetical protein [Candidatus Latescibacterota bacterium]NIO01250.1 hypothetical protein [Candidatus Latescibacterota bacterium]NIO27635.1 hypothetical protein [Candidatus Latescibacterota bacterium]